MRHVGEDVPVLTLQSTYADALALLQTQAPVAPTAGTHAGLPATPSKRTLLHEFPLVESKQSLVLVGSVSRSELERVFSKQRIMSRVSRLNRTPASADDGTSAVVDVARSALNPPSDLSSDAESSDNESDDEEDDPAGLSVENAHAEVSAASGAGLVAASALAMPRDVATAAPFNPPAGPAHHSSVLAAAINVVAIDVVVSDDSLPVPVPVVHHAETGTDVTAPVSEGVSPSAMSAVASGSGADAVPSRSPVSSLGSLAGQIRLISSSFGSSAPRVREHTAGLVNSIQTSLRTAQEHLGIEVGRGAPHNDAHASAFLSEPIRWAGLRLPQRFTSAAPLDARSRVSASSGRGLPVVRVDAAPFEISDATPLAQAHYLFALCQWQQLLVLRGGQLAGVVLRESLLDAAAAAATALPARQQRYRSRHGRDGRRQPGTSQPRSLQLASMSTLTPPAQEVSGALHQGE